MKVRVAKIAQVADKVKRFRFERADGHPMPIFSGGAHVIVSMRDGTSLRRNPYSLMSSPADTGGYEISVLRVENSRGGSAFLHEALKEGDTLTLSQPVNLFAYDQRAKKHIMMAGGIGITPMVSMAHALGALGMPFTLHYLARSTDRLVLMDELRAIPHAAIVPHLSQEGGRASLAALLGPYLAGDSFYACGPVALLQSLADAGVRLGWPAGAMHFE
eukprot:gene21946-21905_t